MKECEILFELLDEFGAEEKTARALVIDKLTWKFIHYVEKIDAEMQALEKKNKGRYYYEILVLRLKNKLRVLECMLQKLKNIITAELDGNDNLFQYIDNIEKTINLLKNVNI